MKIQPKYIKNLFELRQYAGQGPISAQINRSIEAYIKSQQYELEQIEREIKRQEQEDLSEQ